MVTSQKKAGILALARAGDLSYTEIGRAFGVSRGYAHQVAREAGISRNPNMIRHGRPPHVFTDAQLDTYTMERVIRLLDSGWLTPGFYHGTPEQRTESNKRIAAWLRSHLSEGAA